MTKVGIDALYVYSPECYVDNAELATARGSAPKHFTEGVGVKTFSVPPPNEDQSSMAATAAHRLMEANKVSPADIFRIDTPTESGLDSSRALVSDVVGMLEQVYGNGSMSHVLGYEQKFACVSGMERYLDTSAWFAAGWNTSKYALIVATDIAKYDLKSREEPTQGAAAAAVLVGKDPRLLEIIPGAFGAALRNEKGDFKKPGGRTVALVDGAKSYASYLTEMKMAWLNFKAAADNAGMKRPGESATIDAVDRAVYHNPHKKMVISAYASLLMHEWRSLPRWKEVVSEIGPEPSREGMDDLSYYMSEAYGDFRRKFMNYKPFADDFAERVGSSVVGPELVGNSYSVSVFVGLESMFEKDTGDLGGKRVVLCGYGSGSHAVIQANMVPERFKEVSKGFDLISRLGSRKKLSIDEYERIHEGKIPPDEWSSSPSNRFVLKSIGQEGTKAEGDRQYALAN